MSDASSTLPAPRRSLRLDARPTPPRWARGDHWPALKQRRAPVVVVGMGYVGLPLAALLAEHVDVVGLDIDPRRVADLAAGIDRTGETADPAALSQPGLSFTTRAEVMKRAPVVIVAVPTPVDAAHTPDLGPLRAAARDVGHFVRPGAVVVFESTVYPGCIESVAAAELEAASGLTVGEDLFLGYSPERINPGDRVRTLDKVTKIVAGQQPWVTELLEQVYGGVITAGLHRAPSIRVAEAAKVIENVQRDLNIALVNELAMLFDELGIDTLDVLEAAGTKWNFLPFRPGLVGGHCVGVDPYYLTHLAETVGFHPQVIAAGRRINDGMGAFIAQRTLRAVLTAGVPLARAPRVAVCGVTFKEDVADLRNAKSFDVLRALEAHGCEVFAVDPVADPDEVRAQTGRTLTPWSVLPEVDAVVLAVRHRAWAAELTVAALADKLSAVAVVADVKGLVDRDEAAAAGLRLWRL